MVSSWTRARTHVPCIGRQILNHCTTREARDFHFFIQDIVGRQAGLSANDHRNSPGVGSITSRLDQELPVSLVGEGVWAACKELASQPRVPGPHRELVPHWQGCSHTGSVRREPSCMSVGQITFLVHASWIGCLEFCIEKPIGLVWDP